MASLITPNRFIELKAKVKAECQRRQYVGSVASYGGIDYDYSISPTSGGKIVREHYDKNADPLNAIIGNFSSKSSVIKEQDIADMEASVTNLAAINATASNSGCASSCTGLCQGGCATSCTGCSGSCSGDCSGNCGGSCGGCSGCSGSCGTSCSNNCSGSCNGCSGSCGAACSHSCTNTCSGGCKGGCSPLHD